MQRASLAFGYKVAERTEDLPDVVSPLKGVSPLGGIDSPIGYAAVDGEVWVMTNSSPMYGPRCTVARFRGPDFEHQVRQPDGAIDVPDTGETGLGTFFCGGMWYDESTGKLHCPIHCEYEVEIVRMLPLGGHAGWVRKKTRLATSLDKGLTWHLEGDVLTDYMPDKGDWLRYSGSDYGAGPADFDFYVDSRGGHFYLFSCAAYSPKDGELNGFRWYNEVARCAISDKMAPGKWRKFCNGTWTEPGLGGKASRVAMGSYGLYGRVIYSRYLQRYLRIGVRVGCADRRFTDAGFRDGSIYVSGCTDLALQDWSPPAKLWDKPDNVNYGITLTDGGFYDPFVCDQALHVYNYWMKNVPSRALDVTLDLEATTPVETLRYGSYAYEPHPESGDPIESRQTKIVGCASADTVFAGAGWHTASGPQYYEQRMVECRSAGSSVALSFRGDAVYWRAEANHDAGQADVYVDDVLAETVDCYYREALPYQFAFIRTGLDPTVSHTIKVVVRGDRNAGSAGTAIRHIAFEYSAESYKASAGYSGVMGRNNWFYQERHGQQYSDLHFLGLVRERVIDESSGRQETRWRQANCWQGHDGCTVGNNYQVPGSSASVREWVAPRPGTIRIEGTVAVEGEGGIEVMILQRCAEPGPVWEFVAVEGGTGYERMPDGRFPILAARPQVSSTAQVWPARRMTHGARESHDVAVSVSERDSVFFVVQRNGAEPIGKAVWDPVITFV